MIGNPNTPRRLAMAQMQREAEVKDDRIRIDVARRVALKVLGFDKPYRPR